MIVRDKETEWKYLESMLADMHSFFDEIIIATDDTTAEEKMRRINGRFDAKVVKIQWPDDFSKARNESLKHATKDWIMVLDPDEIILKDDMILLKRVIESDRETDAFELMQYTYNNNRFERKWQPIDNIFTQNSPFKGCIIVPIVRLFRNHRNIRFIHRVHELVDENGLKTKTLKIPVHHMKYFKGADYFREVEIRNIELMKKYTEENPSYPKPYMDIGLTHLNITKNYDEAVSYLQKALGLAPDSDDVLLNLGRAYSAKSDYENAVKTYAKLIELYPDLAVAYFNLAAVYSKIGRYSDAVRNYELALKHGFHDAQIIFDRINYLKSRT